MEAFQPKDSLKYIRSGLSGFSQINEWDVAYLKGSNMPHCDFYLIDNSMEFIDVSECLKEQKNFLNEILDDIQFIRFYELFNYQYSSDAFKYNYELIAKYLKENEIAMSESKCNIEREQYISDRLKLMIDGKKELLNKNGIDSPVWSVGVVGISHLRGIKKNLRKYNFVEQENLYK